MSEYATPTTGSKSILSPTMFWRLSAYALAAVALLGIVMSAVNEGELVADFLNFDWTHNVLHVILAGAAFVFGYASLAPRVTRAFALIFGIVYLALGVVGFVVGNNGEVGPITLELGENLVHLLIGAWGALAGIMK